MRHCKFLYGWYSKYNGPIVDLRKDVHIVTTLDMKLRVLRAERALTLREASERTGVDKVALSRYERGLLHPQDRTLAKIARGYGVPVAELLEEEPSHFLAEAPVGAEQRRAAETARIYTQPGYGQEVYADEYVSAPSSLRAYVGALEAEVAALRAENERLHELAQRQSTS
jgi:transcriptional regulator with XRE-family HTH domain